MIQNLLIIGAGIYGLVAKEVAERMGCFLRIDFVDDRSKVTPDGTPVIGTTQDLAELSKRYTNVVVAIGNPEVRQKLIRFIEEETLLRLVTLVSPKAYVSPSAQIGKGCIVEPMAVIHARCVLGKGCLICAGTVIDCSSVCGDCVHVGRNATVAKGVVVSDRENVSDGTVYQINIPHGPIQLDGQEYCFKDGM